MSNTSNHLPKDGLESAIADLVVTKATLERVLRDVRANGAPSDVVGFVCSAWNAADMAQAYARSANVKMLELAVRASAQETHGKVTNGNTA